MTEQNPDSNLKEQDHRKWVEGQPTEALEKELSALELRRTVLQNMDPEMEAEMTQEEQEEWAMEYSAKLAAATPEERKAIIEEYEGPDMDESTSQRLAEQLMIKPEKRAQPQAEIDPADPEIPPWQAERVTVNLRIGVVQRELSARRTQALSKREAASALARAHKLPKPPAASLMPSYRSKLKQGIWMQLAQNPRATNSQIVRGLDADGTAELPATWESGGNERSFWEAFTGIHKGKVEKEISRVRTDLRKRRLLSPR